MTYPLTALLLSLTLALGGCASFNRKLQAWLGADPGETKTADSKTTKFSESPDLPPNVKRQYKRTTKESLAGESALEPKAGSLWVMEGQGAYLFSQNIVRLVGDPLAVNLDGDPREQIQSKVGVIKKLLARIEEKQRQRLRDPADVEDRMNPKKKETKVTEVAKNADSKSEPDPGELGVKHVPTRIIERTLEGNYRVKGAQPFLIGNREYKVIVTGVVKAEDFNDEGISAAKLLDSKFDIVSSRGGAGRSEL